MKTLFTKDGEIVLNNDKTITVIGKTAHDVYFNLHRLLREVYIDQKIKFNQEELSNDVYNMLDDERAIDFQEIVKIELNK